MEKMVKRVQQNLKETLGISNWGPRVSESESKEEFSKYRKLFKVGAQFLWTL
jgi:hypothetical protein